MRMTSSPFAYVLGLCIYYHLTDWQLVYAVLWIIAILSWSGIILLVLALCA
jgi:hypothetical protein